MRGEAGLVIDPFFVVFELERGRNGQELIKKCSGSEVN